MSEINYQRHDNLNCYESKNLNKYCNLDNCICLCHNTGEGIDRPFKGDIHKR